MGKKHKNRGCNFILKQNSVPKARNKTKKETIMLNNIKATVHNENVT